MEDELSRFQRLWKEVQDETKTSTDYRAVLVDDQGMDNPFELYTDHVDRIVGEHKLFEFFSDFEVKGQLAHELGHIVNQDIPSFIAEWAADDWAGMMGYAENNIQALKDADKLYHTPAHGARIQAFSKFLRP